MRCNVTEHSYTFQYSDQLLLQHFQLYLHFPVVSEHLRCPDRVVVLWFLLPLNWKNGNEIADLRGWAFVFVWGYCSLPPLTLQTSLWFSFGLKCYWLWGRFGFMYLFLLTSKSAARLLKWLSPRAVAFPPYLPESILTACVKIAANNLI